MIRGRPRQRRQTTRVRVSARGLVPQGGEPWYTCPSWVRPGSYAVLGMLGGILGLRPLVEHIDVRQWPHLGFFLGLLIPCTLFCLAITLCMVLMQALNRRYYQWCPECLQAMTRGAHVCPFCGFRPGERAPDRPASRPA